MFGEEVFEVNDDLKVVERKMLMMKEKKEI
jgi:hypothetical protein